MNTDGRRSGLGSGSRTAETRDSTTEDTAEYRAGYAEGYGQGKRDRDATKAYCASCEVFRNIEAQYPVRFTNYSTASGEEILRDSWASWRQVEMQVRAQQQLGKTA